jgi:uncharacterized membrane protein
MRQFITAVLVTYLIADFIWLGFITRADYTDSVGHLMRDNYVMWPWILFYLVYSACILRLALFNGAKRNFFRVFINAFMLGLASYGTYNLTNYAILADWPLSITLKDWIWGTSLTTGSALVGYATLSWLARKQSQRGNIH